jgi:hypothetical protein
LFLGALVVKKQLNPNLLGVLGALVVKRFGVLNVLCEKIKVGCSGSWQWQFAVKP